jgi:outer membrane lipoprotein-sorting protein
MLFLRAPKTSFLTVAVATLIVAPIGFAQDSKPAAPVATAAAPAKDPAKAQAAMTRGVEKNSKRRDYTADVDMKGAIMGMDVKGTGKLSVSAKGQMRQEMATQMPMMTMNQTIVNDGKNVWMQMEVQGMPTTVTKGTVDEMNDASKKMGGGMPGGSNDVRDPSAQLGNLAKMIDADTIEENVDIDGKPYWAVSGSMKKDAFGAKENQITKMLSSMMKRVRVLFAKDTDLFSGMEFIDASGKPVIQMRYKNMNFEPKFDDKTFAYEPPAGVKVQNISDALRGFGAMGGEDSEEDEDEEPAKPASKPAGGK